MSTPFAPVHRSSILRGLQPLGLLLLASLCLVYAPDTFAADLVAGGKVGTFLTKIRDALVPISITVVTIAFVFAGYQIAFNPKRISDVSPVLVGAIVIGAAAQLAGWFIG